jgi:hypothetical protein
MELENVLLDSEHFEAEYPATLISYYPGSYEDRGLLFTVLYGMADADFQRVHTTALKGELETSETFSKALGKTFDAACRSSAAEPLLGIFVKAFVDVVKPDRPASQTCNAKKRYYDLVGTFIRASHRSKMSGSLRTNWSKSDEMI